MNLLWIESNGMDRPNGCHREKGLTMFASLNGLRAKKPLNKRQLLNILSVFVKIVYIFEFLNHFNHRKQVIQPGMKRAFSLKCAYNELCAKCTVKAGSRWLTALQ
jgi:hypothetical protein